MTIDPENVAALQKELEAHAAADPPKSFCVRCGLPDLRDKMEPLYIDTEPSDDGDPPDPSVWVHMKCLAEACRADEDEMRARLGRAFKAIGMMKEPTELN
jgi:hypothetical protein